MTDDIEYDAIEAAIYDDEHMQGFAPSTEQRQAVLCSVSACLSLILDGASTRVENVVLYLTPPLTLVLMSLLIWGSYISHGAMDKNRDISSGETESSRGAGILSSHEFEMFVYKVEN